MEIKTKQFMILCATYGNSIILLWFSRRGKFFLSFFQINLTLRLIIYAWILFMVLISFSFNCTIFLKRTFVCCHTVGWLTLSKRMCNIEFKSISISNCVEWNYRRMISNARFRKSHFRANNWRLLAMKLENNLAND